jgi:hypothetical protein
MAIYATQRNATRNQSTVDYREENIFLYGNRYSEGVFINNTGETINAKDGFLVVRNSGTFETATVNFADLTNGQTIILAGLTYTATGAVTATQVAEAFANRAVGYVGSGALSGTLTGYATGANTGQNVVFTASTVGPKTDITKTGTGSVDSITIVNGTAGVDEGFSPATSATLANVIGILKIEGENEMQDGASLPANYCHKGDIDTTLLVLPLGVNLDSVVGSKALKDILTGLGFSLKNVIELSKYGN